MSNCLDNSFEKVRLLHITTVGMSFTFFQGQISYIKKSGFDIVTLSSYDDFVEKFTEKEGVEHISVTMLRRISPLHDIKAIYEIVKHVKKVMSEINDRR